MKILTPQISWHSKEPIYSVDFHPNVQKIATAGGDNDVKIWKIVEHEKFLFDFLASLARHSKSVNVVRFSPNDGLIYLWKHSPDQVPSNSLSNATDEDVPNKECWTVIAALRGHLSDVYDLCWSPDGNFMLSASTDNSSIVWDIAKGKPLAQQKEHTHYVQGVAWDPQNKFIVTQSCDRTMNVFDIQGKKSSYSITHSLYKIEIESKKFKLFEDEKIQRLDWSPDGNILIAPAGIFSVDGTNNCQSVVHIFTRYSFSMPVAMAPVGQKPAICVRFNPLRYERKTDIANNEILFDLPYRMIFAVATLNSVLLFDTQQMTPFCVLENIHYAELTDLSWSKDGAKLLISSKDGYCTFVNFQNDFGKIYSETK